MPDFINRLFFGFVSSAIFIGILAPALSQPGHQKSLVEPAEELKASANATFSGGNSYTLNAALTGTIIQDRLFFGLKAGLPTSDGFYCNTFLDSDVVDDNSDIHAGARLL